METACSGIRQKTGRRPAIARAFSRQSGKIAANYKKTDDPAMEHTQTNGPIRGISRRFTLPVRPETPGRCTGRKPEGLSRESARKKKIVRPCKPDVSVHFADIQRLLAEREGFEPPVQLPVHRISSAARSTTPAPLLFGRGRRTCARSPDPKPLFWDCKYRHIFYFRTFSCGKNHFWLKKRLRKPRFYRFSGIIRTFDFVEDTPARQSAGRLAFAPADSYLSGG